MSGSTNSGALMIAHNMSFNPSTNPKLAANQPLMCLDITFVNQGQLTNNAGGVDQSLVTAGYAKQIPIIHFEQGASRSVSAGNQSISGSPVAKPVRFVTAIDSYVALMTQACITGEQFSKAIFHYVEHSSKGAAQTTMSITYTDGFITHADIVNGLFYCELTTRTLAIDNVWNKPFSGEFFGK